MVGDEEAKKRERKISTKEESHSEPTNRRERKKHRKMYKKNTIKLVKNLHKNSLDIRKDNELNEGRHPC